MRYINIKTGAVIDSPCFISGENWIEDKKEIERPVEKNKKSKAKE